MPSYKKTNGEYQDICFPLNGDLRKDISNKVLGKYQQTKPQEQSTQKYQGQYAPAQVEIPNEKGMNGVRGGSIEVNEDDLPF